MWQGIRRSEKIQRKTCINQGAGLDKDEPYRNGRDPEMEHTEAEKTSHA